jgi:mRNA-degrading endonuclease toxin of MazEF toxin-antitoxin module
VKNRTQVVAVPFEWNSFDEFQTLRPFLVVIKPLGEDSTPATVTPVQVSLVEPVAYLLSYPLPPPPPPLNTAKVLDPACLHN